MSNPGTPERPAHVNEFLQSPAYVMVLGKTIESATESFKIARALSVTLFSVGILLVVVSMGIGVFRGDATLSALFGGLGTANLLGLLLYRPIERIQRGVDDLIRWQIGCLSFIAQYNALIAVDNPTIEHRVVGMSRGLLKFSGGSGDGYAT